jgi:hypothetical protein
MMLGVIEDLGPEGTTGTSNSESATAVYVLFEHAHSHELILIA